jgi:membrane-bound lytic murein transglycosylase MltF
MAVFSSSSLRASALLLCGVAAFGGQALAQAKKQPAALDVAPVEWRGDFDRMLERGTIRVVVPYSRSLYFNFRGHQRGLTADALEEFERWLNKHYAPGGQVITLQIFPVSRDELLARLAKGHADIAAGNLTMTAARDRLVEFSAPIATGVNEILVTGSRVAAPTSLDDLSKLQIHVRPASSAHESLKQLDQRLRKAGKPPLQLVLVPDVLEDEDLLDMMNAGLVKAMVVDDWKARAWAPVLKRTRAHPDLVLREGASIAWALRQDAPQLKKVVDRFLGEPGRDQRAAETGVAVYAKRWRALANPTLDAEWRKFERSIGVFRKYGARYRFDPLMLAAQAYQESRLDPAAVSRSGAVGLMQVLPSTGALMKVGDIHQPDANVHAGTKYMRQILDRHFKDAEFSEQDRNLFAFASYNAGPTRIARMRGIALRQGLDPNRWFNHVEIAAGENIGEEPVRYVRNIYKYYTAYRLQTELIAQRQAASQELRGTVVTGTATFAERVSLPRGAVFEAILEDVSKGARVISTARVERPANATIAFKIPYDPARIHPKRSYAVRARIVADGRVLFTTDQHYPMASEVILTLHRSRE